MHRTHWVDFQSLKQKLWSHLKRYHYCDFRFEKLKWIKLRITLKKGIKIKITKLDQLKTNFNVW